MNIYKKILQHNKNFLKEIEHKKIKSAYLKREDVYISSIEDFDENSVAIDVCDGLVTVHYDLETYKIVGFTVLSVKDLVETFGDPFRTVEEERETVLEKVSSIGYVFLASEKNKEHLTV